jgi:hypothetical protein
VTTTITYSEPTYITYSELKNYLADRRRWWLADVRGLRLRKEKLNPTGTRAVGDRYHQGLEAYYRAVAEGETDETAHAAAYAVVTARFTAELEEYPVFESELLKERELVMLMLEGYFEWLAEEGEDADLEILAAEEAVQTPLLDPDGRFVLLGKLDARARKRSSGHTAFLEHKAVSNLTDLPKWAHANPQFLHYHLLEFLRLMADGASADEAEHERTDGLILNMGRTVKRTARATPPFFAREHILHNREELRSYWLRVMSLAEEMQRARERLAAGEDPRIVCPANPTRDSTWADPFWPCYTMLDDGSDFEGYLAENYVVVDPLERYRDAKVLEV